LASCKLSKNVPNNQYLLKKNVVEIKGKHELDISEVSTTIRQQPNSKTLFLKIRLMAYNMDRGFLDSTRISNKRIEKNLKLRKKNKKRIDKQNKINEVRIEKARYNGKETYTEKIIPLKDTLEPRRFFAEWWRFKYGEYPVIFDSAQYRRSISQLKILSRKRGYYHAEINAFIDTNYKSRKITPHYIITPNNPYIIDSLIVKGTNTSVLNRYNEFRKKSNYVQLVGERFDADLLDRHRIRTAKFMRDEKFFGFSHLHILFEVDTFSLTSKEKKDRVIVTLEFLDKPVKVDGYKDSVIYVKHRQTSIRDVYFHIADTTYFNGDFKAFAREKGVDFMENNFIRCFDTLYFDQLKLSRSEKKKRKIELDKDTVNIIRQAYFLYNGELGFDPGVLEAQNYLEKTNPYKEYYLERTYTRLIQLGLFQTIKPVLIEIPGTNKIDVHYYLVPSKKQSFSFEPRATNSNGILGLSSSVNYTNRNLFKGSERLTWNLSFGFESQPPVFGENLDGSRTKRTLNTLEISPSVKLDLPGLFPIKSTRISKRQRPRTVLSAAYSYQKRFDYTRNSFQLNYMYKFFAGKTQVIQAMAIFPPVIKFVSFDNFSETIITNLLNTNDQFLRNTYSDQFIWQDLKFSLEFNNRAVQKGNASVFFNSTIDHAGFFLNLISSKVDTNDIGQRLVFGVPYANFARIDNEFIIKYPHSKKTSTNLRLNFGAGIPYGNSQTSLPFDYSFFAGGTNDNRGWATRTLGPGAYKYYLDTNRTLIQLADIRLASSLEFRFSMGKILKGAIFTDAGNIWTYREDPNRIGSQFTKDWFKQISIAGGIGMRADFDFFILRLDAGIPLSNPALPEGARWIFNSRDAYIAEVQNEFGANYKKLAPRPFIPRFHFGIGYPF
jgi:outer membrane protein insertion porin family